MKNLIIFFGAFLCLAASCKSIKMDNASDAKKLVEFAQSACYGNCPHYHVAVNTDGSVLYTGKRNVERMGVYQHQLTKKEYIDLVKSLAKADLYSLDDIYDAQIMDGQVTRVTYHGENGTKKVATKHQYPGSLKMIVDKLHGLSNKADGWVAIDIPDIQAQKEKAEKEKMEKEDKPTRKVFSYSQGACFGKCSVFSLDVLSDMSVIYVGKRYAPREGIFEGKLSQAQYDKLISLVESDEFMNMQKTYDQNIMDAQSFKIAFINDYGVKKEVNLKITKPEVVKSIIALASEIEANKSWKKKEAKNSVKADKTILVSLRPGVKAKTWVGTQKHLKLKVVRYLSPNGTYVMVSFDEKKDRNRVMEELRRNRDVLSVAPGDQPAKPRGNTGGRTGKSGKKGKVNIGGSKSGGK